MKKVLDNILSTFSVHFLTHFFLCMYIIFVYQRLFARLNFTVILDIHC